MPREPQSQSRSSKPGARKSLLPLPVGQVEGESALFRRLLETSPDAVLVVNQGGIILFANLQAESLFEYPPDTLVGQNVDALVPGRLRPSHAIHRQRYAEAPRLRPMGSGLPLFAQKRGGSEFPVEISLSPLETAEGTLVACAVRDIGDRKATERALKLSNRELEAFSYSVAHDLRAPLRGMNGFARVLLDGYLDKLDSEGQEFLHEIMANAKKMADLIDALLSLSRVTLSDLRVERVDLAAMARDCVQSLAARESHRNFSFSAPDTAHAALDARLARVLMDNLIGNAWKYTAGCEHARLEFGVETEAGIRVYFVRDNGAGFDPRYQDKLFVPFQRLHPAQEFAGTGVGLATVQRVVHRHGGRIWAKAAPNQGATFWFTIDPMPVSLAGALP
jgi:PAS domain S-box-containing protein